jgi:hypothetical protein
MDYFYYKPGLPEWIFKGNLSAEACMKKQLKYTSIFL